MIEIELEPAEARTCECCGSSYTSLTRFVLKDGAAHAVYFARLDDAHQSSRIHCLLGLGEWGEGASPQDRVAFALHIWEAGGNSNVALVDAAESPWSEVTYLGRILDRDEALSHSWKAEVFHLTDHMVEEDPEISSFLGRDAE